MAAIVINTWPTRSTPDVIQPVPFVPPMSVARAVELLKTVRNIPQPVNTPEPADNKLQFPRYYMISFNGRLTIKGVKRNLQPTKWYAVFDVDTVVDHGYWHPKIIDDILAVLEPLTK
jgi:plasmid replication initiation protein